MQGIEVLEGMSIVKHLYSCHSYEQQKEQKEMELIASCIVSHVISGTMVIALVQQD